jgi:hypothetical protein
MNLLGGETTVELLTREKIQLEDRLRDLQQLFTANESSNLKMESLLSSWNEAKVTVSQLQIEISYLQHRLSVLQEEYRDVRGLDELKADWNEHEKEMQALFQQTKKQFEKEKILIKSEKEKILAERTHLHEKVTGVFTPLPASLPAMFSLPHSPLLPCLSSPLSPCLSSLPLLSCLVSPLLSCLVSPLLPYLPTGNSSGRIVS